MSLFKVDKTKCIGDGYCASVCPVRVIRMEGSPGIPVPVEGAEERCIACGHCAAVCPRGALSLDSMSGRPGVECPPGWELTPDQVEQLLKGRRSIRVYKKDKVSRDILEKIIGVARYAPSGMNRQPVKWLVFGDSSKVRELAGLTIDWMRLQIKNDSPMARALRMQDLVAAWEKGEDLICRNAPAMVIPYGLKDDFTAAGAATVALAYFEIAALPFKLGTCWAGYANMALNEYEPARELAGISRRCAFLGAMMVGYPQIKYLRIPERNPGDIKWK